MSATAEQQVALSSADDIALADKLRAGHQQIITELRKLIVGQDDVIEQVLVSLFAGGNCLIIGVPGLAKTLLVHTIARVLDLKYSRIQFTPDLMVRPLLRRASDEHIALYLEEHEPSLDAAVLSAVEHGKLTQDTPDRSPLLARRLIESAIERSHEVSDGARVDQPHILRAAMFAGTAALIGFLAVGIGPAFLRDGARLLLAPCSVARKSQRRRI